jgi:hypothetical protein
VEAVERGVGQTRREEALRRVAAYRGQQDDRRVAPSPEGSLEELRAEVAELLELTAVGG